MNNNRNNINLTYSNQTKIQNKSNHNQFFIPDQNEIIFDERQTNLIQNSIQFKNNDYKQDNRTQEQVMTNLSFSIQDLLSKMAKVREQFEEPAKYIKNVSPSKKQVTAFKYSNLSTSTQANSTTSKLEQSLQQEGKQKVKKCQSLSPTSEQTQIVLNSQKTIKETMNEYDKYPCYQSKKQIKNLLSPQNSNKYGTYSNNTHQKLNKLYKRSIIIQDHIEHNNKNHQSITDGAQDFVQNSLKKVKSLFDGKIVREVAASTIFQSPIKNNQIKHPSVETTSNHNEITSNHNETTSNNNQHSSNDIISTQTNNPIIRINRQQSFKNKCQNMNIRGKQLCIQDFILGKQLGSGKFGDVYQALHKQTGLLFAIKKIFKSTIVQYNMVQQFTRQLKIHYSLNYPNIIKLYAHFSDQYHVFLLMQYGQGGMLIDKLGQGEKYCSQVLEQMVRAVQYLHQRQVAHRDIKPENIVIMFGDTAKLCDFGWARVFDSRMKTTFCGTLDYVSPEMKDKGEYSLNIDIWSLGVLTFQLICGFAPFKNQITNWKKKGSNLNQTWNWNINYPAQVSTIAQNFMRNLLKQNPNQRANIRFCLTHIFIKKHNQINFQKQENERFDEMNRILQK